LKDAYDRFAVEVEGKPLVPIIPDMDRLRAELAHLFEKRHILVHEMPLTEVVIPAEARGFVTATQQFVKATEAVFQKMLYGDYPLTQAEMTQQAWDLLNEAEKKLDEFVQMNGLADDETWQHLRSAFQQYAVALSTWRVDGGTTEPMEVALKKRNLLLDFFNQVHIPRGKLSGAGGES
jgi:hypothetical protein